MKLRILLLLIVLSVMRLTQAQTVVDIISNSPDHNTLETAILAAGLDGALMGDGPFTVFAPTDDAFAALPVGTIDALLADPQGLLTDILTYHVVGAKALSSDLSDGLMITTLNGKDVTVTINADGVFINNAQVTIADLEADNGVVHVINAVLLPPTNTVYDIIAGSDVHTTLRTAIDLVGFDELLKLEGIFEFSVFAPTNDAFDALPAGILDALLQDPEALANVLAYHVAADFIPYTSATIQELIQEGFPYILMGNEKTATLSVTPDGVFINDVQITVADLLASNGVVHVIDAVLLAPDSTIIDVVEQSPDHTLLSTILDTLELKEPLRGYGPFTLFAPTDAAILALGPETINNLLNEDVDLLSDIVAYHVVGGKALSSDLSDGQVIPTLLGENISVTINNDGVFINNARVTVADIQTDNGVVHVIDAVLLPPTNTVYDIIANSDIHTTLKAAIDVAGLDGALQGEGPFTVFAPTDDAFNALPDGTIDALLADPQGLLTDILTYHVAGAEAYSFDLSDGQRVTTLNGKDVVVTINTDGVFINNALVIVSDLEGDNGVVHVIDAVLLPPTNTVYDIIANSDIHTTLKAAIDVAGLDGALQGEGPFTVFAPTDDAFNALPDGTIDALLADPQGLLTDILTYHVVGAEALSSGLTDGQRITTLSGQDITVMVNQDGVFINDARVIIADIPADNGVVHVIDAVLLPESSVNEVVLLNDVKIYPNPTNSDATLSTPEDVNTLWDIHVTDLQGKSVIKTSAAHGDIIQTQSIHTGTYLLHITDGKRSIVKKLVKF